MCDLHDHLSGDELAEDQYVLDTPVVRTLVATVREELAQNVAPAEACASLRPVFEELLARRDWLPEEFQHDVPDSGRAWAEASASGCCSAPPIARSASSASSSRPAR